MEINQISNRTIFRILAVIGAFIGLVVLIFLARRPLSWLASAIFLAVAVDPAVNRLSRYMPKKNRGLAALIVFVVIILLFGYLIARLVPLVVSQTQHLVHDLIAFGLHLSNSGGFWGDMARQLDLQNHLQISQSQVVTTLAGARQPIVGAVRGLFSGVAATLTTIVLTFFVVVEGPEIVDLWNSYQPEKRLKHQQKLMRQMYRAVTGYVSGNLLTSLIAAVASALMLTIIRVPYAVTLGLLVGIIDLLPLVGATLASVIVILISAFTSLSDAVIMLVFFLVYQQLENHILVPYVYSRTVKLSPLMVLVSALIGATLGGFLGALVAIPVAASLQILVLDFLKTRYKKQT